MLHLDQWNVGKIAERIVANELEARGFRVSELDRNRTATNADLLAVSTEKTLQVQVKGAVNGPKEWWVQYGYCTADVIDRKEDMFNRKESFYKSNIVILVAVRSPHEYSCVILPVREAERAAQLNLDSEYRTPTKDGRPKKPHKVWVLLEPRPNARMGDARFAKERSILSYYRDEKGWELLLQSNRDAKETACAAA